MVSDFPPLPYYRGIVFPDLFAPFAVGFPPDRSSTAAAVDVRRTSCHCPTNCPRLLKSTPSEDGVPCYNPNLPRDWNNCISEYKNLLQQRTIDKFVPPDLSYYRNCLLLDDVGNCVSGTNESANCSNP
ncbi:hypothetical protein MLD38_024452 [Melastoma candidum]|uniref:Uncharacterized protein n=1 Tax=Melastoma candidum TaxID=119954 RepID=A0ACB9NUZ8_9MYRT|nr:hypothetical protein MLD38_024452 [Melastoma candidum]